MMGRVTAQAADAAYFTYLLACQSLMQNGAQQFTAWKELERNGGSAPATGAPVLPAFPTAVPAVPLGIEVRFRALVKAIKANASYNPAIGEALGIEGAVQAAPDFATLQPRLKLELTGGAVKVGWGWQGQGAHLDMTEIEVDRGSGYTLLTMDTTPDYLDTTPLPTPAARWKYRAIYRVGDQRVGQWSDEVGITVGGRGGKTKQP